MRRRLSTLITRIRTTALGPLTVIRSSELPPTPDAAAPIVNAFNQLEQHLDELRDVGHRLSLASRSLSSSAREIAVTVERLDTPAKSQAAIVATSRTAVPSMPRDEQRPHLRLLKPVA